MSDAKIRNWLQRSPHPNRIRTDSGEVILLQGRRKWQEAMESIEAADPSVLEALDRDGNIIRTLSLDGTTREPRIVEDQLTALARIITESNDRAALRHEKAYESSFNAVLELTKLMSARLTTMERAYMALVQRHAESVEAAANAMGQGDDLDALASSFFFSKMMGGPEAPQQKPKQQANGGGQPNGKGS